MFNQYKRFPAEKFQPSVEEHRALFEEYQQLADSKGVSKRDKTVLDYYFTYDIVPKTIYLSGLNKHVRGNLQYILDELNHNDDFEGYTIYIRTSPESEASVKGFIAERSWTRTQTCTPNILNSQLLQTCEYLLTEIRLSEAWCKAPGQTYINIWHGTPLKRLGLAKKLRNIPGNGVTQRDFICADYLLYPNDYTRKNMLKSFKVQPLMQGQALMLGYPRTGGMLAMSEEEIFALRQELAPNGEKLYAYMPTFRDYLPDEELMQQCTGLLDYLDANLRDDQLLYVNLHHRISVGVDYSNYHHIRQFPAKYGNYQVLMACDTLITDYSSVFFDYLATGKQIILHVEDYEVYAKKRGTYMNLLDLPLDKAYSSEEVLEALNRGKTYDDTEAIKRFCKYDSPKNAAKLCRLFLGKNASKKGLKLIPLKKEQKNKVLLYSQDFHPGTPNDLLTEAMKTYDKSTGTVYLSCDQILAKAYKPSSYPMLFKHPAIGVHTDPHLSSVGKRVMDLYQKELISFDEAIRFLGQEYAVMPSRMYGKCSFQQLFVYDLSSPEMLIGLAEAPVSKKLLFLQDELLEQIENGDRFMKDALVYSVKFFNAVFVSSAESRKKAEALLKGVWENPIQIVDKPSQLCSLIANQPTTVTRIKRKIKRMLKPVLKKK